MTCPVKSLFRKLRKVPKSITVDGYTALVWREPGPDPYLWARVVDLPGCHVTGDDLDELREALREAIAISEDDPVRQRISAHLRQQRRRP